MTKIKLRYETSARDGGTKVYVGSDGKSYYEDHRLTTKTKGSLYDTYPNNPTAKMLNWCDFEKEED